MATVEQEQFERMEKDRDFLNLACKFKCDKLFNIFDAIGMRNQEIKHSNFLAWLFDPEEKHGWGSEFIERFLQKTVEYIKKQNKELSEKEKEKLSKIEEALKNIKDDSIQVLRERKHIDILIIGEEFACVIENKINACEHNGQLNRYADEIENNIEYKNKTKLYLYLKPSEEEIDDKIVKYYWTPYELVKEILADLSKKYLENKLEIKIVVKHYINLIERLEKMSNLGTAKLCRDLYKKYPSVIDTIINNLTPRGFVSDSIKKIIEQDDFFKVFSCGEKYIRFLPASADEKNESYYFQCCNEIDSKTPKITFRFVNKEEKEVDSNILKIFNVKQTKDYCIDIDSVKDKGLLEKIKDNFKQDEILKELENEIKPILKEIKSKENEIKKYAKNNL